jgi:hypothetical protein
MGVRSALALAVLSTLLASGFVWSCSSSTSGSRSAACTPARIGGRNVCLKAGVPCRQRYERRYRSYALTCRDGQLRDRPYIGPPNP